MNIEKRIDDIISKMTLAEKIGQLNQISVPLKADEKIFEMLKSGKIGSFIMATTAHAGNDETESVEAKLLNKLQKIAVEESRLGIPVIFGRDVIHGHKTVSPIPLASAASFNEDLVRLCYRNIGREAARDGVQWTFAPMLDVSRDPRWGRCVEGSGEDPYLGAKMAKAVVEGFQGDDLSNEDSIAACAKHFIGYGASEGGRDYHRTEISDYSLRNYYLPAFKSAVDNGVQTVMSSFNEISGQPSSSSKYLLTDVLRGELGFDGFVISDWGAVIQTKNQGVASSDKEAAEICFNAGLDMDMVDDCYINYLEESVNEGKVDIKQIDESVRRVLRVKLRLGLFENPYIPQYKIDYEAHKANARKLAAESIVLLKNKNDILPLKKDITITLTGPMAFEKGNMLGSWCLDGEAKDVISINEGIKNNIPECKIITSNSVLDDEQLRCVRNHDVTVLCLGESKLLTGEANSIASIEVSPRQVDMVKAAHRKGKPVVAVLFYGRPVALTEIEPYCDAVVWAWHPGTEAGNAVADILFGNANPSAKLPMSLPRCTGQIPIYYNPSPAARNCNGYYGKDIGINYHDCNGTPMYRFGYGLSYSKFQIDNLNVNKTEITLEKLNNGSEFEFTLDLKNLSNVDGNEVVQLYIRDKVASMARPLRELKGYKKVFVTSKGTEKVSIKIGFNELGFYNAYGKFVVEPGEFDIFIGNDCYADKVLTISVI